MIDIHSHILPAVDDGAKSIDESLELIRLELKNDVDTIVLTPHFNPMSDDFESFLLKRENAYNVLQQAVDSEKLPIRLILGAEIFFSPELLNLDLDKLSIGDTDYILIEFPFNYYPTWAAEVFYQLLIKGKTPIIAHVERYSYFEQNPFLLYKLVESGCYAQINADSILRHLRSKFIKKCISHNLVHFIASDSHSPTGRYPVIKDALKHIDKKTKGFSGFVYNNAKCVVNNQQLDIENPIQL